MIVRPGGNPGPAANSIKPDVDGHQASRMTKGECACCRSPAPGVAITGRTDRDRSTRAGYLPESQHHMLPASWRHSQTANTISRRGPEQHAEVITGELTFATVRQGTANDLGAD